MSIKLMAVTPSTKSSLLTWVVDDQGTNLHVFTYNKVSKLLKKDRHFMNLYSASCELYMDSQQQIYSVDFDETSNKLEIRHIFTKYRLLNKFNLTRVKAYSLVGTDTYFYLFYSLHGDKTLYLARLNATADIEAPFEVRKLTVDFEKMHLYDRMLCRRPELEIISVADSIDCYFSGRILSRIRVDIRDEADSLGKVLQEEVKHGYKNWQTVEMRLVADLLLVRGHRF